MPQSGSCLCGAVRYNVKSPIKETGACHCSMCRKWSGGVYMAFMVPPDGVEFEGEDNLSAFTSSPWAERVFCKTCGGNVFYRVTAEGPLQGTMHVGFGTLDDASGIAFTGELYIDLKPDSYSFAGDTRKQMTEAEVLAMFSEYGN